MSSKCVGFAARILPLRGCIAALLAVASSVPVLAGDATATDNHSLKGIEVHLQDASGKAAGRVAFQQAGKSLHVMLDLKGLPPGEHAVYLHNGSACEGANFANAGPHGSLLGLVTANANGVAHMMFSKNTLSITAGTNAVVQHTIVVHTLSGDLASDSDTNPTDRLACGVIQQAQ